MNGSPSALTRRAPSPRSASDSRKRGWPVDVEHGRVELHELEVGDFARRPRRPSRSRRRTPPRGWSSRGTPGRRRRSRAASHGPAALVARRRGIQVRRRRRRGRPRRGSRWRARARRRGCAGAPRRGPKHPADRRDRWRRARAARGGRCAPPRGPAPTSPFGWRSKARAPVHQLGDVGRALRRRGCAPRGRRRARRRRPACPSRAAPGRVVVAHRGGDAALRVAGVALGRGRLGQEQDLARTRRAPAPRGARQCRCRG